MISSLSAFNFDIFYCNLKIYYLRKYCYTILQVIIVITSKCTFISNENYMLVPDDVNLHLLLSLTIRTYFSELFTLKNLIKYNLINIIYNKCYINFTLLVFYLLIKYIKKKKMII